MRFYGGLGGLSPSPLPACGERSDCEAIRERLNGVRRATRYRFACEIFSTAAVLLLMMSITWAL